MRRDRTRGPERAPGTALTLQLVGGLLIGGLLIGSPPAAAQPIASPPPAAAERPKIGVALSGGGAKGCAHIGVLQVLEELGVPVDYIAGTSMGSIIGGLYATGYSADQLGVLVTSIDWAEAMRDRPPRADLSFRRKQKSLRYPFDLELGLRDGQLLWPRGFSAGQNLFFLLRSFTLPVATIDDFDRLPIPFRAVAADIQTGDEVVLGSGDLARALRASMAIPGFFAPVQLDGRTLVDGGVVNNLPIDLVRAMGADVVIAVALGDPLAEGEVGSMLEIVGQTQAILTKRNVDPQLPRADLVIRPDVAGFSLLNFEVAGEIVAAGERAARTQAAALKQYAVVEPYRHGERLPAARSVTVDSVRFEGESRVDRRILDANVTVPTGEPLDFDRLADGIARLYGLGDFESIEYSIEQHDEGGRELVLQLRDKPWGPNYLHFGLGLTSDLDGALSLALLANYTATRLDARGAEWSTDLQLGTENLLYSEYYQPLDFRGAWFVAPRALAARDRLQLFERGAEIAELEVRRLEAGLDVGYQFDEYGEIRLGVERGRADVRQESGRPVAGIGQVDYGAVVFGATLDRLDTSILPSRGGYLSLQLFRAEESLGAEDDYTKLSLRGAGSVTRGRHIFVGGLTGGWSPGRGLPLYDEHRVGGLLSLSGFEEGELRGQEFAVLRAGYFYELSRGGAVLRRLLAGGWLEAGDVWGAGEDADLDDLIYTGTLAIAADTLLGPVYLAYGYADGGSDKLYLGIGRSF